MKNIDEIKERYADKGLTHDEMHEISFAEVAQWHTDCKHLLKYIESLEAENATYREAKQDGRLAIFPCKVGDTVYWISPFRTSISQGRVMAIKISAFGHNLEIWQNKNRHLTVRREFEKVFLTREEAEAALSQQKNKTGKRPS